MSVLHRSSYLAEPYSMFVPSPCSECGLNVELEDVPVQSLVPEPLRSVKTGDEYMQVGAQFLFLNSWR